jgi:CDP-diacylglycerol--serine O-phosphatidyltransferase
MVSNGSFIALKFTKSASGSNLPKIMLGVFAVVAGIFLKWLAVPVIFLVYVILSLTTKKQLK